MHIQLYKMLSLRKTGIDPVQDTFLNLGYYVETQGRPVTQAAKNSAAYILNPYITQGKMVSSEKAEGVYRRCNSVIRKLLSVLEIEETRIKLHIIQDGEPNVFILPASGDVVVSTGLLSKPGLTEGEFAGFIAHEIEHYLRYNPDAKVPRRFKNPLYEDYRTAANFASRQGEEYQADELALIILDLAGYSLYESIEMLKWAELNSKKGSKKAKGLTSQRSASTKILDPSSTHPKTSIRISNIEEIINNPKYKWQSLGKKSKRLLTKSQVVQIRKKEATMEKKSLKFYCGINLNNPMDVKSVDQIAEEYTFEKDEEIFSIFLILRENLNGESIKLDEKLEKLISQLKSRINEGDIVALFYLKALISYIYFDYAGKKDGSEKIFLKWLSEKCKIEEEEVVLSFIAFIKSHEMYFTSFIVFYDVLKGRNVSEEDITVFYKGIGRFLNKRRQPEEEEEEEDIISFFSLDLSLEEIVNSLTPSILRDQLIAQLLHFFVTINDRCEYIDDTEEKDDLVYFEQNVKYPLSLYQFSKNGVQKLMRMLFGTEVLDEDYFKELLDFYFVGSDEHRIREDLLSDEILGQLFMSVKEGFPYSVEEYLFLLDKAVNTIIEEKIIEINKFIKGILIRWDGILEASELLGKQHVKNRMIKFGMILFSKVLEKVPPKEWGDEVIRTIESFPKSSEKNYLLILLHKAGIKTVDESELLFEQIPSPDSISTNSGSLTLINSFGFLDSFQGEAVYPLGQRTLDEYFSERLPKNEALQISQVLDVIPRSSPFRDELLDRCEPGNIEEAKAVLDSYWSPTSAYAKAFHISRKWLEETGLDRKEILKKICEITDEFPSLRRRMIREWAEKFGMEKDEYRNILKMNTNLDAVDMYKGVLIGAGEKANEVQKITLCLATFAVSLLRDGHSLISIEMLPTARIEDVTKSVERKGIRKAVEDHEEEKMEAMSPREQREKEAKRFDQYHPFVPEEAYWVADAIWHDNPVECHTIPFVDNKPSPNFKYMRKVSSSEMSKEMKKWNGARLFYRFMQALGWEETIVFYENLLFGISRETISISLLTQLEEIFIKGIGLLLAEKGIPLSRVENIKKGIKTLLDNQSKEIKIKIWARVLAGIAQQQSIGEILREAVKPLGYAGGKIMQAIHSLTSGVDTTLEEATRMALDQTAFFSLLDALQFLGFRYRKNPFDIHERYNLLGQGTVRAAVAGHGGKMPDEAYLLVHARHMTRNVVYGLSSFIREMRKKGEYFPLSAGQFAMLVEQAGEEQKAGFLNHMKYGKLHGWQLGKVKIPRVLEHYDDWARMELAEGVPFLALPEKRQKEAAQMVVESVLMQLMIPGSKGTMLINPEFHHGNILVPESEGMPSIVDCGLIGEIKKSDIDLLFKIISGYKSYGIYGAAANILKAYGYNSMADIRIEYDRNELIESIKIIKKQIEIGVAPELLLSSLVDSISKILNIEVTEGIDTLFRALQHLAPYLRKLNGDKGDILDLLPKEDTNELALELKKECEGHSAETAKNIIPKGIAVGKKGSGGKVVTIGVLIEDADISKSHPQFPGMIALTIEGSRQLVKLGNLMVQIGQEWKPAAEFLSKK